MDTPAGGRPEHHSTPCFEVRLFGKFTIKRDNLVVEGLSATKAQEVLSYLLLNRDRPQPREALATTLWRDGPGGESRKALRQALWQIQTALGGSATVAPASVEKRPSGLLDVDADSVRVRAEANVWLDVARFERASNRLQEIPGPRLTAADAQELQDAIELYAGDLLEGWSGDWCIYERERFQITYLAMLDKAMSYFETNRFLEKALHYGQRILRRDRAHERTHRRVMRLHYLAGDRTAALHQFERCAAALREELDVRPSRRTLALYEQIRADRLEPSRPGPLPRPSQPADPAHPLSEVLTHLRELRGVILDLHHLVQRDIDAVEQALNRDQ